MKKMLVVVLFAFAVFGVGPSFAQEYVTALEIIHPASLGFQIQTQVQNGYLTMWLSNGYPLVIQRDSLTTLPFTTQTTTQGDDSIFHVSVTSHTNPDLKKTCCWFTCTTIRYGIDYTGTCNAPDGACRLCDLTCSSDWDNCPAGSTEQHRYMP